MNFTSKFLTKATKLPQHHSADYRGLGIVIEWPKGSVRTGEDKQGKKWKRKMEADYGYIPDTVAAGDKEGLDVYIGPAESDSVYVVEQLTDEGDFDEYKVMLGFPDMDSAFETYLKHYPDDWEDTHVGEVFEVPFDYAFDSIEKNQDENEGENPAPKNANNTGIINSPTHDRSVPVDSPADAIISNGIPSILAKSSGLAYMKALQSMES